jgi:hypothetical protein
MPRGVYPRKPGRKRPVPGLKRRPGGGRKPQFFDALHVQKRKWDADYLRRRATTDEELEQRLEEKFRREGWDSPK